MIGHTRRDSPRRFYRRVDLIFGVFALPLFLCGATANAGTVRGMDGPHRVPWAFRVELKRERIMSFKRLEHIGPEEINTHSVKWLAVMATIDAEISQIVTRLAEAHPHVQISSVTGRNNPSFLLRGSDEEARAMADEADVESVESLGAADELIENVTMNPWE
jgi:hypothetical protein